MIPNLTNKKQFELFAAAMALGGLVQKDGHTFRANLAQDEAQQLTEAMANRGFFDGAEDDDAKRYKPPVQRARNNQPQIQNDEMIVVNER